MNYDIGEYYPFRSNGSVYFVSLPSCSIWRSDEMTLKAMETLRGRSGLTEDEIRAVLDMHVLRGTTGDVVEELKTSRIIKPSRGDGAGEYYGKIPVEPGVITHLICNISHSCNLTCRYCYAESGSYGGDTGYINERTAKRYVDFLMDNSGESDKVSMTFFGGEPLLNFPVIESTVLYGRKRAEERGKRILFDLTTNATLLTEEKIRFLNDNRIVVTVSIDGPRATHDLARTRPDGSGTYDTIVRNIKPFLESRPVPGRVTMTRKNLKAREIIDHLLDLGFFEIGISPVDSIEDEEFGLNNRDMEILSDEFERAADVYLEAALNGGYYGFTNVTRVLKQLHEGISKVYPCGAGLLLYAGDPDGNLFMCHRLVGKHDYCIGSLDQGIDEKKQVDFLTSVSVLNKDDCQDCWIRYLCSGGCYYQSVLYNNDHTRPYLSKCEWLRRWFHKCLEIYVTLLERNPAFIEKHAGDTILC